MSVSCFDCFSDLLCDEDSSGIFSGDSLEILSEFESLASIEESMAGFVEDERHFVPGFDYLSRFQSDSLDASARAESVAWILKAQAYYGFQPLTAYLAVNYMDRFLYSSLMTQITNGWQLQLLSVACLSLAAKMEEPLIPPLVNLQVGAKYIFEPKTICRMELLVLRVLNWRLRSVTPFSFLGFFACKLDPARTFIRFLSSRATEIILSHIPEAAFLEYWPSCIAASALLCAGSEVPNLSIVNPEHAEKWCTGLSKEKIIDCCRLMQEFVLQNSRKKPPKIIPQLRVTIRARMRSIDSSPVSSSSFSSYKRRKLSNCLWVDDDKEKPKLGEKE